MKKFQELSSSELALALDYFAGGQYYLLLGSGVSMDSSGAERTMRSAGQLRSILSDIVKIPQSSSLQQAYSLLSPAEIEDNLTKHYSCSSPGETIKRIAFHPWKRTYTLNIDDCFEKAFEETCKRKSFSTEATEVKNFDDNFTDIRPDSLASIIHLHGAVRLAKRGYVFSHAEYAKLMTRPNSWMLTLSQLIRTEPFIIAGTTLDEIDVTYYLEQRALHDSRSDVPVSILIEPFPTRLTQRLCDQHGFCLYEGAAIQFFSHLEQMNEGVRDCWKAPEDDGLDSLALPRSTRVRFSSTFERVPAHPGAEPHASRLLLGVEPSWSMMDQKADVARDVMLNLRTQILGGVRDPNLRILLLAEEPGSGKTTLLTRLAFDLRQTRGNVLWFTGVPNLPPELCAAVLEDMQGDCIVFVDNWADHWTYFSHVLHDLEKKTILFVGSERTYRIPYIDNIMTNEDYSRFEQALGLTHREGLELIRKNEMEGFSTLGPLSPGRAQSIASELEGQPIGVASCRIQSNFRPFDVIISEIIKEAPAQQAPVYAAAAISRFCYAGGVRRTVLNAAFPKVALDEMFSMEAILPLKHVDRQKQFVVPRNSVVADRVLAVMQRKSKSDVFLAFTNLANAVAHRVDPRQIRNRSPDARLTARLLDFDQIVKKFINDDAEKFYEEIKGAWSWNSRYWEQLALLKLDRYLVDRSDGTLMDESIQHARHAYSIEKHPLALTTLAKVLFIAMGQDGVRSQELFEEGWRMINESIDIEVKWENIRATAFVVCFNGVLAFVRSGGLLTGEQADRLRYVIGITHSRKLRDKRLIAMREEVRSEAF